MKKKKLLVSILAGVMAAMMLLSLLISILPTMASAASSDEIKQELEKLESQQGDIWAQLDKLEGQLKENWSSIEEMVEQKDNIDQQIALLYTEIANINEQIRSYTLLIADNQAQLDEAEAKLAELNEKNKERIRAMEEEGTISYWSVLFKANSFTELIDCINMMEEIQEADERRLAELDAAAQEVARAREQLETEKAALEESRVELENAQAALEVKRLEASEILTQLNADKQALEMLEAQYEEDEAVLSAQIAATEKELTAALKAEEEERKRKEEEERKRQEEEERRRQEEAEKDKPGSGGSGSGGSGSGGSGSGNSGDEDPPSEGSNSSTWGQPCSYIRLTSPYGWRIHPTTGEYKFHHGVDLANSEGTPIYATRSGTVTVATWGGSYGNYVTINHYDGYSSLYAHMTHYVVSKGDHVEKGQLIGYMGSTGRSTGPHLHFAIYYNGSSVNPMDYID